VRFTTQDTPLFKTSNSSKRAEFEAFAGLQTLQFVEVISLDTPPDDEDEIEQ
jgi:hypothetical protein